MSSEASESSMQSIMVFSTSETHPPEEIIQSIIEHSGIGSNKPVLQMEGLSMPSDGDDATPQRYHRVSLENKYFATKVHFVEFNDTFTLSVKLREHFYGAIIYMDLDNVTTQTDKCIEYMEYVKTFPNCSLAFVVSHPVKEDMDKAVLCRLKAKLEDNDFDIGLLDFDADQDEHNSAFFHFTDFLMSMQTIDWPHAVFKKDPTAPADSDCKAFKFEELFCNLPGLRKQIGGLKGDQRLDAAEKVAKQFQSILGDSGEDSSEEEEEQSKT